MALPQPTYTRYRPQSFLDEAGGGVLTKALELYAKYHPAAMQQRVYAAILEDEQFAAKSRQEQRDILAREREALTKTLANFRETGLGPSGRGGGAAGGARAAGRGSRTGNGPVGRICWRPSQETYRQQRTVDRRKQPCGVAVPAAPCTTSSFNLLNVEWLRHRAGSSTSTNWAECLSRRSTKNGAGRS